VATASPLPRPPSHLRAAARGEVREALRRPTAPQHGLLYSPPTDAAHLGSAKAAHQRSQRTIFHHLPPRFVSGRRPLRHYCQTGRANPPAFTSTTQAATPKSCRGAGTAEFARKGRPGPLTGTARGAIVRRAQWQKTRDERDDRRAGDRGPGAMPFQRIRGAVNLPDAPLKLRFPEASNLSSVLPPPIENGGDLGIRRKSAGGKINRDSGAALAVHPNKRGTRNRWNDSRPGRLA